MKYNIEKREDAAILGLHHKAFDSLISSEFKAKVLELAKDKALKHIVMDLSEVDYIDSSGIGAMLFSYRQSKESKFKITISGINNSVLKMFRISNILDFFSFSNSIEEAFE